VTLAGSDWHAANDAYLAASLRWLRLLLERAADAPPAPPPHHPAAAAPEVAHHWPPWRRRRPEAPPQPAVPKALPVTTTVTQEEIDDAARERARAADVDGSPPALVALASQLGLSPFERDILLLCSALALDPGTAGRCARVQSGDTPFPHPTFALALLVLPDAAWDALSPQRGLRYWQLIEISQLRVSR
jgi:hypothetical protein